MRRRSPLESGARVTSLFVMNVLRKAIDDSVTTIRGLSDLSSDIDRAAGLIREALLSGNKLMVCGNGGSAADGADFAAEFTCRFCDDRRPFPAINLAVGGSLLTAIGNDYGYDEVFARQLAAYAKPGDVLVTISTSGKSANIRRALEQAKASRVQSIAMLGKDGGTCSGLATIDLIVRSQVTARIQEAHKFLVHVLCEMVDPDLMKA